MTSVPDDEIDLEANEADQAEQAAPVDDDIGDDQVQAALGGP